MTIFEQEVSYGNSLAPENHGSWTSSKRILIVDDEPFNNVALLIVLKLSIKQLGYHESIINDLVD